MIPRLRWGLALLLLLPIPAAAQPYTLSGYVEDAETGERLIGATLYAPTLATGAVTNSYGFFSLTVETDTLLLRLSYVGYQTEAVRVQLPVPDLVTFALQPEALGLDEIQVEAEADPVAAQAGASVVRVPIAELRRLPAFMGETDVLKALQLLPGVQSGSEGTSGLYVRGGGPDQNLLLLDDAPVYNASHLFGFFSIFNSDAIRSVELVKGGFPARYGGRLSSVIDLHMKEGNLQRFAGTGTLGLIASRLTVEGPIQKHKSSFIVSGRRTYVDVLARPFLNREDGIGGYYFYDLNAKVNYIFSPRSRVYLSTYFGDDRFYFEAERDYTEGPRRINDFEQADMAWGNATATLRWTYVPTPKAFLRTTFLYSNYRFLTDVRERETIRHPDSTEVNGFAVRYDSGLRDWAARVDLEVAAHPRWTLRTGLHATHHTFSPGAIAAEETEGGTRETDRTPRNRKRAFEGVYYLENTWRPGSRWTANLGVHTSAFAVDGRWYGSVQPRLSAQFALNTRWRFKGSFTTMQQYIHLLTNSGIGLPTDLWVPATETVRPQRAEQASLGLTHTLPGGSYELHLEGYAKWMHQLIAYEEGANFLQLGRSWEDKVVAGEGRAYGFELWLRKAEGRTTGWVGYTLASSERRFPAIDEGRWFPYRYDRRHDVSLVMAHDLSERRSLGLTWVYGTGQAVTLPTARYASIETPFFYGGLPHYSDAFSSDGLNYYGRRNGERMRAYHRLDLSYQIRYRYRRSEGLLSFSVYNAYNRKNPFFLYLDENVYKQVSLFPVLPAISYTLTY